jgi:hypothetical protein
MNISKHPWFSVFLACLLLLIPPAAEAGFDPTEYIQQAGVPEDLRPYAVVLPPGTSIAVVMQDAIDTQTGVVGQPISAFVSQDIYVGTKKILSRSDRFLGHIERIDVPFKGRHAILKIGFDQLVLANGVQFPCDTVVDTGQPGNYWGGDLTLGTRPETVPYKLYHIGAYGRVVYRGPRAMGEHLRLDPGDRLVLNTKGPLLLYAFDAQPDEN